ncbi:MAG: hypothetical protein NTV85_28605 [Hyphomicrobiales bacterium]|nr:hypothetical protein [Hyphomicrobiales bacterium]
MSEVESTITGSSRLLGGRGGFHQVVLTSSKNGALGGSGASVYTPLDDHVMTIAWNGTTGTWPVVIQDTDGYTGTAGDLQARTTPVTSVTIPAGLGGSYRVGVEHLWQGPLWWVILQPDNPQQVPYQPGNGDVSPGDIVWGPPADVYVEIRVNGSVVAGDSWSEPLVNPGYQIVLVHIDEIIEVVEGDVITASIRTPNTWSVWNALGGMWPADPPGIFFLTFLHGKAPISIGGHVTYAAEMAGGR